MTLGELVDGAVQLSTLALDAASVSDPLTTVNRVSDLAAKLIPCVAADVVRVTSFGELRVLASSDAGLSDLTGVLWHRWPHRPLSPSVQGPIRSHNHGSGYSAELLADCGIACELMFALQVGDSDHGYLRFLFRDTTSRVSSVGRLAAAFSVQAAITVDRAALLVAVAGLAAAVTTNRDIAAAAGILMAQRDIGYDDAYLVLRSASQNSNRKLRDVADQVLNSRRLPDRPGAAGQTPVP